MSIERLTKIFESLTEMESISLQLLKIINSKKMGTSYFSREINLSPREKLREFVCELSENYLSDQEGSLFSYEDVVDYDGSRVGSIIYKLSKDSVLLQEQYKELIKAISRPDVECNPLEDSFQAYMIKGKVKIEGVEHKVKLFSIQNPLVTLRHKFAMDAGEFKKVDGKVLSLKPSIDVIIFDDYIYMLTLAGEKLFNMERTYKKVCFSTVEDIARHDIIINFEQFEIVALTGHNPRRFIAYNDQHLIELQNVDNRRKVAEKFSIGFDGSRFHIKEKADAEKLVKLLCNKGMLDPFDEKPMEVAGSKKWS